MWPYSKELEEKWGKVFADTRCSRFSCFFNALYRHGYIKAGEDHLPLYTKELQKHGIPFSVERENEDWYELKIIKNKGGKT